MLKDKLCEPRAKDQAPMTVKESTDMLEELTHWTLVGNNKAISRSYKFRNFKLALEFVNRAGSVAETENHHPDFELGWGYVKIKLLTHEIGGLHINDFIVAAKIDSQLDVT